MDTNQFSRYLSQLRKDRGLTQKELAHRLHVTDKAISRWETGRGFPDIRLMEPLAGALGISVAELLQCGSISSRPMEREELDRALCQAMDHSRKTTALRYLRLFRIVLISLSAFCLFSLLPYAVSLLQSLYFDLVVAPDIGVIGSADGPTAILTQSQLSLYAFFFSVLIPCLLVVFLILFLVLSVRVGRMERKLRE